MLDDIGQKIESFCRLHVFVFGIFMAGGTVLAGGAWDLPERMTAGGSGNMQAWDNVESRPYWAGGKGPSHSSEAQQQTVELSPGDESIFLIPEGETLRLTPVSSCSMGMSNLIGSVSYDGQLFADLPGLLSVTASNIVCRPNESRPVLIRVVNMPDSTNRVKFVPYISRHLAPDPLFQFDVPVNLDLPVIRMRNVRGGSPEKFKFIGSSEIAHCQVEGPGWLAIQTRLLYSQDVSERHQMYRLRVENNGEIARLIEHDTVLSPGVRTLGRYKNMSPGDVRTAYVYLSGGPNDIQLAASSHMAIRLCRASAGTFDIKDPEYADSFWSLSAGHLDGKGASSSAGSSVWFSAAKRFARDRQFRDGGLEAVSLLRKMDMGMHYDRSRRQSVADMESRYTFFRNLMPQYNPAVSPYRNASYVLSGLVFPGARRQLAKLPEILESDLYSLVGQTVFIPSVAGQTFDYALSSSSAPGKLRLLVLPSNVKTTRLFRITVDNQRPVIAGGAESEIRAESSPPQRLVPVLNEWENDTGVLSGTLSSEVSANRYASPLVRPQFIEIPIRPGARRVSVECLAGSEDNPVSIALQQQSSSQVEFGQSDILAWFSDTESSNTCQAAFLSLLKGNPIPEVDLQIRDRINAWVPVARLLRSRENVIASSLAAPRDIDSGSVAASTDQLKVLRRRADDLLDEENQEAAAVVLARLVRQDRLCTMPKVRTDLLEVLSGIDETYLAVHLARGILIDPAERPARGAAYKWLTNFYESTNDNLASSMVQSFMAVREPTPAGLVEVARRFIDEGRPYNALLILLALPSSERPLKDSVQAAAALGWPDLLEYLVEQMPAGPERELWLGVGCLIRKDVKKAGKCFSRAGEEGVAWQAFLESEKGIRYQIYKLRKENRTEVLEEWQDTLEQSPLPSAWRTEQQSIVSSAGARMLYSAENDLHVQTFLSVPGRPVRIHLLGPQLFQLEIRPLHDSESQSGITGWLQFGDNGKTNNIPVLNNTQSRTALAILGDRRHKVGRIVPVSGSLDAGSHSLSLGSRDMSMLVRVRTRRSALPYTLLPEINRDVAEALLGREEMLAFAESSTAKCRLAKGLNSDSISLNIQACKLLELPDEEASMKVAQLGSDLFDKAADPSLSVARAVMKRNGSWETLRTVHRSAGVRVIKHTGWSPESAGMRVRAALLGESDPTEHLLASDGVKIFNLFAKTQRRIRMVIALSTVPYLSATPADVKCSVDGVALASVRVDSVNRKITVPIDIDTGSHNIEVQVENLAQNHFIGVVFDEEVPSEDADWLSEGNTFKRAYHLASPGQPLVIRVPEPTLLRVIKTIGDTDSWSWHLVDGPAESLKLTCDKGQRAALFRVARYSWSGQSHQSSTASALQFLPVQPWLDAESLDISPPAKRCVVRDMDGKRHEDGTFSLHAEAVSRRDVDEGRTDESSEQEEFIETGISHRYFMPWRRLHVRSSLFAREHTDDGTVLGLEGHLVRSLFFCPATFRLSGRWMTQDVGSSWEQGGSARMSMAHQRGNSSLHHSLTFAAFARMLDSNWKADYPDGELDMDLYTDYKRDHQYGLILSDYGEWRPRGNLAVFSRIEAASNEGDMDLEYVDWRIGTKCWLAPLGIEASYRQTRYFKDADREQDSTRNLFSVNADIHQWHGRRNRIEYAMRWVYDMDDSESSVWLTFSLHRSAGRLYRDFAPGEVDFATFRQEQLLLEH